MSMYPMNNLITQTIHLYKAEINRDDLISDWYDYLQINTYFLSLILFITGFATGFHFVF